MQSNQAAKKDIKEFDYKQLLNLYTPEVTAQIIKLDSEDKAKEVLELLKRKIKTCPNRQKTIRQMLQKTKVASKVQLRNMNIHLSQNTFKLDENGISDVITIQQVKLILLLPLYCQIE